MKRIPRHGEAVELQLGSDLRGIVAQVVALPGPPRYLVGGPVRDLLLGRSVEDLDFAVAGDVEGFGRALAGRLEGVLQTFARFGTAKVMCLDGREVDLAALRRETYRSPGALPRVEPASLEEDLRRRDFSINAMALELQPSGGAILHDPWGGAEDLAARRLRVLSRDSFRDDPTRLWRGVRFACRLGLRWAGETLARGQEALAEGVMDRLSGRRQKVELRKLLEDPADPQDCLAEAARWGLLATVQERLPEALDRTAGGAALQRWQALTGEVRCWRVSLGVPMAALSEDQRRAVAERLALSRQERRCFGPAPTAEDWARMRPSQAHRLLAPLPEERRAVLWGLAGAAGRHHIDDLPRLEKLASERLTGARLLAAGCPQGPHLGALLARTHGALLDGEVSPRGQLKYALDLWRDTPSSSPSCG
ncbi:MAG: hypothetical protein AAF604_00380 [Acidobacteriota bacterium]